MYWKIDILAKWKKYLKKAQLNHATQCILHSKQRFMTINDTSTINPLHKAYMTFINVTELRQSIKVMLNSQ